MKIASYLTFSRNCEEAFEFYKSVFGGEYIFLVRYGDVPSEFILDESDGKLIKHAELALGEDCIIHGMDLLPSMGRVIHGNNLAIMITLSSKDEALRLFKELAEGGTIPENQEKAPWGELFTGFIDKFGVPWMINLEESIIKG